MMRSWWRNLHPQRQAEYVITALILVPLLVSLGFMVAALRSLMR